MLDSKTPPVSLRTRKKEMQRADLLRVAADMFRRLGYEGTRMEDIAVKAEVSTPTVYNYFQSKRDILIELLVRDRSETQAAFDRIVEAPPSDPTLAFARLIYENISRIRTNEDKRLWRELIGAVAVAHDSEKDQFERNHQIFKAYIQKLLKHFITAGILSSDISVPQATNIIFAINANNLRHHVSSGSSTPERVRDATRQQIALLFTDWRAQGSRRKRSSA